jgi:hypothetical protein
MPAKKTEETVENPIDIVAVRDLFSKDPENVDDETFEQIVRYHRELHERFLAAEDDRKSNGRKKGEKTKKEDELLEQKISAI